MSLSNGLCPLFPVPVTHLVLSPSDPSFYCSLVAYFDLSIYRFPVNCLFHLHYILSLFSSRVFDDVHFQFFPVTVWSAVFLSYCPGLPLILPFSVWSQSFFSPVLGYFHFVLSLSAHQVLLFPIGMIIIRKITFICFFETL
jgi:hypothetical protein